MLRLCTIQLSLSCPSSTQLVSHSVEYMRSLNISAVIIHSLILVSLSYPYHFMLSLKIKWYPPSSLRCRLIHGINYWNLWYASSSSSSRSRGTVCIHTYVYIFFLWNNCHETYEIPSAWENEIPLCFSPYTSVSFTQ